MTDELLLTAEHMLAYIEYRLAARKAFRPDRHAAALKGVRTRREGRG
jgi:hypothetical protein